MWVIVRDEKVTEIRYYRHKRIRYYLFILISKLKGKEVSVIKYGRNI